MNISVVKCHSFPESHPRELEV